MTASLVYTAASRPARASSETQCQKNRTKQNKKKERRKKIGGDRCGGAHLGGRGWQIQCEFKASLIDIVSFRSGYRVGPFLKTNTKATIWKQ